MSGDEVQRNKAGDYARFCVANTTELCGDVCLMDWLSEDDVE